MWTRAGLALVLAVLAARADDAVRRDGTRVPGRLALSAAGRFTFRTPAGDEPVAGLDLVRFPIDPAEPPPAALRVRVRLADGEVVLAELVKLDATHLHVRPTWGGPLAVPRAAIDGVAHAPGWQPVAVSTFDDLAGWAATGDPRAGGGRVAFDRAGQSIARDQKPPLAAGRVSLGFAAARTAARRLTLVLGFAAGEVRVELAGPNELFAVTSPAKAGYAGRVKRDAAAHRLTVEFDGDRLAIVLDALVVWTQAGPGELKSLKLEAAGDGAEVVPVSDVGVSRPVRSAGPKAWADLTADGVRSPDGDETFGTLAALGPTGATLELKARPVRFPWPDVAEVAFRRGGVPERMTAGEHVRVRVRSADGHRDVLAGAVQAFDDRAVVVAHPVLGDVTIPRDRVESVRLDFHGRRLPVVSMPQHLGTRPAFGYAVPRPTGLTVSKRVTVEPVPPAGFVVVAAARVSRAGTPVEVYLNGDRLGTLNALADRADAGVRVYRVPVPAAAWRAGANEAEVRLKAAPDAQATGADVRGVRLELHDGR